MAATQTKFLPFQNLLEKFLGAENDDFHWFFPPFFLDLLRCYLQHRDWQGRRKKGEFIPWVKILWEL